uniref:Uncharacterized protein n=1 Tax=uncultured marine microorganism HF4000_APKG7H23 TaxID=455551 RepID=B3T9V1_9ZZZZ|nr:hypothetical protein ALOHA_HF4000APKG7H23ctg3g25 [uncultured marine microorganism HF4000_APKG7H23]
MDCQHVGPCRCELGDQALRLHDHQMHVQGQRGMRPDGLYHRRADGQIRHEAAVHHVHVDVVGTSLRGLGHHLTQAGEVR